MLTQPDRTASAKRRPRPRSSVNTAVRSPYGEALVRARASASSATSITGVDRQEVEQPVENPLAETREVVQGIWHSDGRRQVVAANDRWLQVDGCKWHAEFFIGDAGAECGGRRRDDGLSRYVGFGDPFVDGPYRGEHQAAGDNSERASRVPQVRIIDSVVKVLTVPTS